MTKFSSIITCHRLFFTSQHNKLCNICVMSLALNAWWGDMKNCIKSKSIWRVWNLPIFFFFLYNEMLPSMGRKFLMKILAYQCSALSLHFCLISCPQIKINLGKKKKMFNKQFFMFVFIENIFMDFSLFWCKRGDKEFYFRTLEGDVKNLILLPIILKIYFFQ